MRRLLLLLGTLLAACGGSSKKQPAEPVAEDPNRALTQAECEQAIDHVIAFPTDEKTQPASEMMKNTRPDRVKECLASGKKRDYDCLMASHTWDELGQCQEPGK